MITTDEVIERLSRVCPASWLEEQDSDLQYILIANIGREIVYDATDRQNLENIYFFYQELEAILEQIDPIHNNEPWSLIGAGMFEAMFSTQMYPRDFLNQFMGKVTYRFWTSMIEGWFGQGIRSLSAYERIIHNQQPSGLEITWFDSGECIRLEKTDEWGQRQTHKTFLKHQQVVSEEIISSEESNRILGLFHPLLAEQVLGEINTRKPLESSYLGFDNPYASIQLKGGAGAQKLVIGKPLLEVVPQRYALADDQIVYTLNNAWEQAKCGS